MVKYDVTTSMLPANAQASIEAATAAWIHGAALGLWTTSDGYIGSTATGVMDRVEALTKFAGALGQALKAVSQELSFVAGELARAPGKVCSCHVCCTLSCCNPKPPLGA